MKKMLLRRVFLFVWIFFLIAGLIAIPAYFLYQDNKKLVLDNLGKSSIDIAATISHFIESDIEPYEALNSVEDYSPGNFDETYYQKMVGILRSIQSETGAMYIYTMKYGDESEFVYVLDAEDPSSEYFSPLGSTEPVWNELVTCFEEGKVTFTSVNYDDIWEVTMVTGLAPIIDPDTQDVLGVVGVDFDYTYIQPILNRMVTIILTGSILFTLALSLIIMHLIESRNEALEIDYLTTLFSKRYFDRQLKIHIMDSRLHNLPLAVMMIDVDSFKTINDQFGHLIGDKILRQTASLLKTSIRRSDVCARYGGDEFSVILPDASYDQAKAVGELIQENIRLYQQSSEKIDTIPLNLSIGIAQWKAELSPDELVNRADAAMYQSKNDPKEKIHFFEE